MPSLSLKNFPLRHRLRAAFLILAGVALLAGAAIFGQHLLTPVVHVVSPVRAPAVEAVYATGVVEPVHMAKVAPLASARLIAILKNDGDRVKKDEVLARLDDREAAGNLASLLARRDFLRQDLARQKALVARDFVSHSALERSLADLRQNEAQIAAAQRPLAETVLRAPLSGVVLRQDGEVGEMVGAGEVLFWIGEPQPLRVTADVDEEDILRVKPGQKVWLKADALPGQALAGRVGEITEKGDSINKNYRVRLVLPNDTPLKTGMTVEVNIVVRENPHALLAPAKSVAAGAAWILRDGRAASIPVKTGVRGADRTEILTGLTGNETLIADPPSGLKAGDRVRVQD